LDLAKDKVTLCDDTWLSYTARVNWSCNSWSHVECRQRVHACCEPSYAWHDGAANMVKSSQLLKVENFQHWTSHTLHLLLTDHCL